MAGEGDDIRPATGPISKSRRRRTLLTGSALVILASVILWAVRTPLAENLVNDQLQQRDVTASYRIAAIGPRTQRLTDVVIGDPKRPDLVARTVELDVRWTWAGPVIAAIRADGVRLTARWVDGRLQMGEVDKLLPPPSAEPFEFPAIDMTLTDARARIESPWGAFGARVDGSGNLRDNFRGKIAVVTDGVNVAGCKSGQTTAFGDFRIVSGKPGFAGPVRTRAVACAAQQVAVDRVDGMVDALLSADFATWQGRISATSSGVTAASATLAAVRVTGDFTGTSARNKVAYQATGDRLVLADIAVRSLSADGTAEFGDKAPTATASLRFAGAKLTGAAQRQVAGLKGNTQAALIGPLIDRYGGALARAATDFAGEADVTLAVDGAGQRVDLAALALRSASGAIVRATRASRVSIALGQQQAGVTVDGDWTLGGGGLPIAQLAVNRRASGQVSGRLTLAPLAAGTTRLVLAPVVISADRAGRWRFNTRALLSGDIAGGRVDGLGFAVDAGLDAAGRLTLAGGCQSVALNRASLAGMALGRNAVRLCSAGGQPLLSYAGGALRGDLIVPAPTLLGAVGESPLSVRAAQARYALATGQWMVDALDVQLGPDDPPSRFTALAVTGAADGAGQAGRVTGGAGGLAAVPLDLTQVESDWRWDQGVLTMAAKLLVDDRADVRRFATLNSDDTTLRFADGEIAARATFAERATGTTVGRAEMRHDFDTAAGSADLIVSALRFNSRFQPDQVSPLALGVIANVDGTVEGRGRIDWSGGLVKSSGTFSTAGSNFAAAFGTVRGASTTIVFDDLLGVRSRPGQRISFDELNPGFPVIGGMIDYQMLDTTKIRIEGGRWPFAGGELILKPSTLDFDVNAVRRLEFELRGVDAAIFLAELGFANINASGVFDGTLPVEFSGLGGRIVGGRLVARPGGGEVAYVGELTNYNLGVFANYAFNMLKSLSYNAMTITLNGDLDGEMMTDVKIVGLGQGVGATRNIITRQIEKLPIIFNVRIDAPFRQLIGTAKSLYDPTALVEQNRDALIAAQRAAEEKPVQPVESEPLP